MIEPNRPVGDVQPSAGRGNSPLDLEIGYPRPDDERGSATAVLTVPAGRFRADQPAFAVSVSGEGADVSVTTSAADGTPRQPNPSEILLLRDELFRRTETGALGPVPRAQVMRTLNHLALLFAQTTPNREAYTGSVLGGYRANPAELGLPRGTLTLDPADNVYLKARRPKSFVAPILLYPANGGPPTVF